MKNVIDSYFGCPLEIDSEKAFYAKLKADLSSRGESGLILGNFFTSKTPHQIDFLVITSRCVCHIELKTLTAPVVGGMNGRWSLVRPDGASIPFDSKNPYRQALDCKLSISDDLHAFVRRDQSLPSLAAGDKFYKHFASVVCVYPELLPSSSVPSDFKIKVCGYQELLNLLTSDTKCPPGWSRQTWVTFAMYLGLVRLEEEDECLPPDLSVAQQSIFEYRRRLTDFLKLDLPPLVPTAVLRGGGVVANEEIQEAVISGRDLQLVGGSGSGKTHFMKHLAMEVLRRGRNPLILSALDYSGKLSSLLDRGIAHLHPETGIQLLRAGERCTAPFVLIVDGFNECPRAHRDTLIKDIKAFSLRWNIPILITTQEPVHLGNGRESLLYELAPPTEDERREILQAYHAGLLSPEFVELCSTFKTPYELSLAAAYSVGESQTATRAELFDSYVSRHCDQTEDSNLVRGVLCSLAARMQNSHMSSLSMAVARREGLRFLNKEAGRTRLFTEALKSGLLDVQQNRCAFKHEMLERFFQAEALVQAHVSTDSLAQTLALPRNRHVAEFIVGIETDHVVVRRCLEELADNEIIHSCLLGQLGVDAMEVATNDCLGMLSKARISLEEIEVELSPRQRGFRQLWVRGGPSWTKYEVALMQVVGKMLPHGRYFDEVVNLTRMTDKLWLGQLASRTERKKLSLTDAADSFADVYTSGGDIRYGFFPISVIYQQSRYGWLACRSAQIEVRIRDMIRHLPRLTLGEKAFLCEMMRFPRSTFVSYVPEVLEKCWNSRIYHLQLLAVRMVETWVSILKGEYLEKTAKLLNSFVSDTDLFLNSAIADSLQALGQLYPFVTVEEIASRIDAILEDQDNPENQQWAYHTVVSIVDSYDSKVYEEAIRSLPKKANVQLYTMAALGESRSFFSSWILKHLLDADDEMALPAFLRWATPPRRNDSSPQFATASYLIALFGCSKYLSDAPLPVYPDSGDAQAWAIYGEIIFWLFHATVSPEGRLGRCTPLWNALQTDLPFEAVDPLFRFESAALGGQKEGQVVLQKLCESYPDEVRSILEFGLKHCDKTSTLFNRLRETELPSFIIRMLGQVGDRNSVKLLEHYCDSPTLGNLAIEALRKLKSSWTS